jgi:hypothetical protein
MCEKSFYFVSLSLLKSINGKGGNAGHRFVMGQKILQH